MMHAVDMPAVHPAADAAVNLVPGIRSWMESMLSNVARLDTSKVPLDRAALAVSLTACHRDSDSARVWLTSDAPLSRLPPCDDVQYCNCNTPPPPKKLTCTCNNADTNATLLDNNLLVPPQQWYANTEPLSSALTFASIFTLATFVLGELTQNWSYVDRVWAVLPVLYSAHFTFHDRWSGAGSVKGLFDWSSKPTSGDSAATWFSAFVPNGVNDRMFLVFILQVSANRSCTCAPLHYPIDDFGTAFHVQVLWSIRITGNTLRRGFFDFNTEGTSALFRVSVPNIKV